MVLFLFNYPEIICFVCLINYPICTCKIHIATCSTNRAFKHIISEDDIHKNKRNHFNIRSYLKETLNSKIEYWKLDELPQQIRTLNHINEIPKKYVHLLVVYCPLTLNNWIHSASNLIKKHKYILLNNSTYPNSAR